jgi:FkbM family methyltransferase
MQNLNNSRTVTYAGETFNVHDEPSDFWGWVENGRYDREWNILKENLRPEHTFIDLGAWVGSHSLYASRIANRVIAVEPDPVAFDILARNVSGTEIHAFKHAIGDTGSVTLGSGFLGASTTRANPNAGGNMGPWEAGHQFDTESKTLRQFVEDHKVSDPIFLKIDVEGSEEKIITDLDFFKERRPSLYLELHPFWWRNEQATLSAVDALVSIYPPTSRLIRNEGIVVLKGA